MSVKPKKHLGQHFLKDEGIAKKIAETLTGYEGYKKVVEIGPGMGVLTKYLLEKDLEVYVIEIDTESVDYLELNYPQLHGKIYPADFLHMPLEKYFQDSFALIGNYPYNISSQILFKALEHKEQIPEITGMFQKEVAERVCAAEGSKIYGIISVLIQTYYDAEYLFTVDKEVFNPPPKVQSGVIRLKRKAKVELPVPYLFYKKVVKLAFNQRRKTLRNALKSLFPEVNEAYSGKRAEQLSVEDFKTLSAELYQNSGMS